MKKIMKGLAVAAAVVCLLQTSWAQFTEEELIQRDYWEGFLNTAKIIKAEQPWGEKEAVTRPWKLTIQKDGITRFAVWKNCEGNMKGYSENWRWEIAAYRLDKELGLNMVPPTVERKLKGQRGSLQLWVESEWSLKKKIQKNIPTPIDKTEAWLRAAWLQQAFDNLIANEDRHMGNVLVTKDHRAILIDHSRTFRTSDQFTNQLLYGQKDRENSSMIMQELPRAFVENLRSLNSVTLHEVAGKYLSDMEIDSVLKRRELLLDWIDTHAQVLGNNQALY
ncbi:MAG: hypothetical protein WBB73_00220 [Candidatus Aminicenantaceae bacterium]